jgi:predicted SnoaL-like aldol condensation-catalyzing enzyme
MDNKQIVRRVYELIFNGHDPEAADEFIKEDYIQHNPEVENGREGFKKFFRAFFTRHPDFKFSIKRLIAEGDYVAVHGHATEAGPERGTVIVDIYRLENGKLAEHWDVLQQVPQKTANNNSMF